jgi:hypothetical protein
MALGMVVLLLTPIEDSHVKRPKTAKRLQLIHLRSDVALHLYI